MRFLGDSLSVIFKGKRRVIDQGSVIPKDLEDYFRKYYPNLIDEEDDLGKVKLRSSLKTSKKLKQAKPSSKEKKKGRKPDSMDRVLMALEEIKSQLFSFRDNSSSQSSSCNLNESDRTKKSFFDPLSLDDSYPLLWRSVEFSVLDNLSGFSFPDVYAVGLPVRYLIDNEWSYGQIIGRSDFKYLVRGFQINNSVSKVEVGAPFLLFVIGCDLSKETGDYYLFWRLPSAVLVGVDGFCSSGSASVSVHVEQSGDVKSLFLPDFEFVLEQSVVNSTGFDLNPDVCRVCFGDRIKVSVSGDVSAVHLDFAFILQ